ncbi:jerky protein homolog-like [Hydra vulgaris]|uniref:jerky protein homolog-like n=1 Tax=Hydra vulgaris TaxID=6087 RepID=UPI0032EA7510
MEKMKKNKIVKNNSKKIKVPRSKRGKHCLWNNASMISAVKAVRNGFSQRAACKTFGVPRSSLQVRLSGVTEIGAKPGHPTTLTAEEENKIVDFACNRASLGIGFGRSQFFKYAENFALKHKKSFKNGTPSEKWWRGMCKRLKHFTLRQPEETAAIRHQCMNASKISKYFFVLKNVLMEKKLNNKPKNIWNMDETGMQFDYRPEKIIAKKGVKYLHSRTSGNRETITVIACFNATGNSIPPHFIVKGKTIRSLCNFQIENAPEGSTWSVSDSGWTKQGIAFLWFTKSFLPNIGSDRPQLLILDGHDSHNFVELLDVAVANKIHIVELPAHTSNWLQPCDRTVFGLLKKAYRKACENLISNFPGTLVSKVSFCGLMKQAWSESVTVNNIKSGFRACGIYPYDPNIVPTEAYIPNSLYMPSESHQKVRTY